MAASPGRASPARQRPIEDVLPPAELLAHYKACTERFEAERDELLAAVDRCGVAAAEAHRLEWENRKRADEIKELQQALSNAQQFLFEERQRLLLLQAENDELKLQELQDRQRIQQLLSLTQPLEQAVTYAQGAAPAAVTSYPPKPHVRGGGGSGNGSGTSSSSGGSTAAAAAARAAPAPGPPAAGGAGGGAAGERVLRTVFLPSVDGDFLLLKIESLQAQLNEQRQLHEERVAALLADRQLREQEEERQRANLAVQAEGLAQQVRQLEEALRTTTKEYIAARRDREAALADAAAARAQLAADVAAARGELAAAKRQARADVAAAVTASESKADDYVGRFREQVRSREEELANLGSLHAATKAAADKRIAELEGRVARLLDANRQLELRRQLDVDGWAADVAGLRKTLAAVDRKLLQMRLIDRLEDDERLDTLLQHLEKRAPSPHAWQRQQQQLAAGRPRPLSAAAAGGARRPKQRPGGGGSSAATRDQQPLGAAAGAAAAAAAAGLAGEDDDDDDVAEGSSVDAASSSACGSGSVKSVLAEELRAVRQQLAELEARAGAKARRAGVAPSGGPRRMLH